MGSMMGEDEDWVESCIAQVTEASYIAGGVSIASYHTMVQRHRLSRRQSSAGGDSPA
ncbi:hypothetical protein GF377_06045 [candidate division GN15 bacterium]|nr:hypothetical protein [candidate division GN15 bacterium]